MYSNLSPEILRSCGNLEAMQLALMSCSETPNPICLSRVKGQISPQIFTEELFIIQQIQPLLRCSVVEKENSYYFVDKKDSARIPFTLCEKKSDDDWQDLWRELINTPFKQENGPLMSVYLLVEPNQTPNSTFDIITCTHHAISDAVSLRYLHYELIQRISAAEKGISLDTSLCSIPPSIENFLIPFNDKNQNPSSNARPKVDIFPEEKKEPNRHNRRINFVVRELEFKQLYQICKTEKTTLHGAFCAAYSFIAAKLLLSNNNQDQVNVKCGTWFDYRRRLNPKYSERELAFYVGPCAGGCAYIYPFERNFIEKYSNLSNLSSKEREVFLKSFWSLARKAKKDIESDFESKELLKCGNAEATLEMIKEIKAEGLKNYYSEGTVMISNLGAESMKKNFSNYEWKLFRYGFGMVKRCPPAITSAINAFADKCYFTFSFVEPGLSINTVSQFADQVIQLLIECSKD